MNEDKSHLAIEFLIEEYNQLLEGRRLDTKTCWKIWTTYVGASLTVAITISQVNFKLLIPIAGPILVVSGLFVIFFLIFLNRYSVGPVHIRLKEIEETARNICLGDTSVIKMVGRSYGREDIDRTKKLFDTDRKQKPYTIKGTDIMLIVVGVITMFWALATIIQIL